MKKTVLIPDSQQLRSLLEEASDSITTTTLDGIVTGWNRGAEKLYGYAAEEILGRSISLLAPPDRQEDFSRVLERLKREETIPHFETVRIRKDGLRIPVSISLSPVRDADGTVVGIAAIARDFTLYKEAEARLRDSETRFRALVAHAADAFFLHDLEGRLLEVNGRACESLGYSREELLRMTVTEIEDGVPPDDLQTLWSHMTPGHPVTVVGHHRRKDGTRFPVEVRIGPLESAGGRLVLALVRDITERVKAEEKMHLLAHTIESVTEMVTVTDMEDRFIYVNAAFLKKYGYTLEEIRGQKVDILRGGDNPLQLLQEIGRISRQDGWQGRLINKTKDGREFPIALSTSNIRDDSGRILGLVGISRDISEELLLEERLRESQRMESVGQLAGGVAHDFNNLLMVIKGHASLLQRSDSLDRGASESIAQIQQAAERAAVLTMQLLAFSRKQIMQPKEIDLGELVTRVSQMLLRVLGEDINLRIHANPGQSRVRADEGMLEQLLLNLALNARDAMPRGGELALSTATVQVDEASAQRNPEASCGEFVCLSVADTGVGIAAENLSRIFEPFFSTRKMGDGTGLGLSTAYGIVKQHRGWIEVTSEPGKGTMFRVFLPVLGEQTPQVMPDAETTPEQVAETILVVEDEEAVRRLVLSVLRNAGYQVLDAESGRAALQVWDAHKSEIGLLVTDVIMPGGISGRELSERLRSDRPNLKVVFTSGYTADVLGKDMVLEEGFNYLQKPYAPTRLLEVVRKHFQTIRQ